MESLPSRWSLAQGAAADPLAAAERACDRIDAVDARVRAFVPEPGRRERLRAEAAALPHPGPGPRPPLYGVPVGVKDIMHVDGLPTRAGSRLEPGLLAGAQAEVVRRLRAAGALVAGKTETAEFAVFAPGPTRNPHRPGHTPGGSSGGSAAAVAAGMVPLALGTQTIGSIVRPAAYCGVVGFKPTHGRVPVAGVLPNAPTLDTVGVVAADTDTAARGAAVLWDGWRPASPGGPHPVLGVPAGPYLEQTEPAALAAFHERLDGLRAAGYPVRTVPVMADFEWIAATLFTVNRYELARAHTRWFGEHGHRYRPETAAMIRQGLALTAADHADALRARDAFRARLAEAAAGAAVDLWAAPSATGPAPHGLAATGDPVMSLPWNLAGLPAVTLPAGTLDGLPVGLQLVGRPGADEQLLSWAGAVARHLPAAPR
ncbi:amidase [Allonocardiopsis opalescens]|nr:amidase [Allonocardiopsis opalescens]